MSSIQNEIPEKTPAEVKSFWLQTAGIIAGIAALGFIIPYLRVNEVRVWPAYAVGVAGVVAVLAVVLPAKLLNTLYRSYMLPFVLIGMVMSRVVLGILFYVVVWPIGVFVKMGGKDPMNRTLDKAATTYRTPSKHPSRESAEAPF